MEARFTMPSVHWLKEGLFQTCFPSALRALGAGDRPTCGFRDGRLRANEVYSGRSSRSTLESFLLDFLCKCYSRVR